MHFYQGVYSAHQKRLPFIALMLSILLLAASCGNETPEEDENRQNRPVESTAPEYTSRDSSLDWDWATPAQDYCTQKQEQSVVAGDYRVLRPESFQYLHESEHFVLRWNDTDGVNISQNTVNRALNTLEAVWTLYIDELNFPEPYADTSQKFKVSVNVSNQGYATGAGTGERDPEMWVHFDALLHDGTLAHEFAHTLQFTTRSMRDSQYVGWLWESHANWMAHQYNPNDVQCTEAMVNAPHIYYGSTRNRYCNWQFFEFLKDNSCHAFVNDALWTKGLKLGESGYRNTDPFTTLAKNTSWSTAQINDVFAEWALHNTHWDYEDNGQTYRDNYGSLSDDSGVRRHRLTRLIPTNKTKVYQVPNYWAPQRWGYNVVELIPEIDSETIDLEFSGYIQDSPAVSSLPLRGALQPTEIRLPNSGWRWSVVTTDKNDKPRYSEIRRGNSDNLRIDIQEGDKNHWLVVMATPTEITQILWDQIYYSVYRYPWSVEIEGARPADFTAQKQELTIGRDGRTHPNGGGFVANNASVSDSAYVGPNARVLGRAKVSEDARIEGYAVIDGQAQISGNAIVKGYALVTGNSTVSGDAIIDDHAAVLNGRIEDSASIGALTIISGSSTISEQARVYATMNSIDGHHVSGTAQLYGDIELNTAINRGVFYGYIAEDNVNSSDFGANRVMPVEELTAKP